MSRQSLKRTSWQEIDIDRNKMQDVPEAADQAVPQGAMTSPEAITRMQLEVASYIEDISTELGAMARAARLDSLAYFIDMTRLESSITRRACQRPATIDEGTGSDTTYE